MNRQFISNETKSTFILSPLSFRITLSNRGRFYYQCFCPQVLCQHKQIRTFIAVDRYLISEGQFSLVFRRQLNVALNFRPGEIIAPEVFGIVLFAVFGTRKRFVAFPKENSSQESSVKVHFKLHSSEEEYFSLGIRIDKILLANENISLDRLQTPEGTQKCISTAFG